MYGFDNGIKTSMDYDLRFLSYPKIERGNEKVEYKKIPGRESSLAVHTGEFENTVITNVMEFSLKSRETITEKMRAIRAWVLQTEMVRYTDEDWYYKVKEVTINDESNMYDIFGNVTVIFECDPFMYLENGRTFGYHVAGTTTLYNSYYESWPVIHIPNYSNGDVISVNGVDITLFTDDDTTELYIDTERRVAYDPQMNVQNTLIKCDRLDETCLKSGQNQIIHPMDIYVQPNWRCL